MKLAGWGDITYEIVLNAILQTIDQYSNAKMIINWGGYSSNILEKEYKKNSAMAMNNTGVGSTSNNPG